MATLQCYRRLAQNVFRRGQLLTSGVYSRRQQRSFTAHPLTQLTEDEQMLQDASKQKSHFSFIIAMKLTECY